MCECHSFTVRMRAIKFTYPANDWYYAVRQSCTNIIGRAGASPPSRTAAIIFLYPCRTSCPKSSTCFFFFDISIFLRRKCYPRFFFSGISIFRYLCIRTYNNYIYVCMPYAPRNCIVGHGFFDLEFVRHRCCWSIR